MRLNQGDCQRVDKNGSELPFPNLPGFCLLLWVVHEIVGFVTGSGIELF